MIERDLLELEHSRMEELLCELDLDLDQINTMCYSGKEGIIEAKKLVESNVLVKVKEKLSQMDSDQIFDFTFNNEGL